MKLETKILLWKIQCVSIAVFILGGFTYIIYRAADYVDKKGVKHIVERIWEGKQVDPAELK